MVLLTANEGIKYKQATDSTHALILHKMDAILSCGCSQINSCAQNILLCMLS